MKGLALSLAMLLTLWQRPHTEPPKDWFCSNHPKTVPEKLCKCHRICYFNPETRQIEEQEDPACKVYCFASHCACLSECDSANAE